MRLRGSSKSPRAHLRCRPGQVDLLRWHQGEGRHPESNRDLPAVGDRGGEGGGVWRVHAAEDDALEGSLCENEGVVGSAEPRVAYLHCGSGQGTGWQYARVAGPEKAHETHGRGPRRPTPTAEAHGSHRDEQGEP